MSRKDVELIANILRACCEDGSLCFDDPIDQQGIVNSFAVCLSTTDPNFDTAKFTKAALPEED